jgi:predicted small integral membrane protein
MMTLDDQMWLLFKAVITGGFAIWTAIAALNNITGFRSAAEAIARTMTMAPLLDFPAIPSPFPRRALSRPGWSIAALMAIIVLQIIAATALGYSGIMLLEGNAGSKAVAFALMGFTVLAALWMSMMIVGLWFGYWIRQEGLQLTHLALLTATMIAGAIVHG